MTGSIEEAFDQQSPLGADLRAGYEALSQAQVVTFTKYVRLVLPLDGYVFWVRADKLSPSALLNASKFNTSQLDAAPSVVTPAPFLNVQGSLHYSTDTEQGEEQVINTNRVVFTTAQDVDDFNQIGPSVLYVAEYDGIRFAFSSRGRLYKPQAGVYHYVGAALYSDMATQLVDDPRSLDTSNVVVSNSLPIWLSMNSYQAQYAGGFGNVIPLYPSFLSPLNLTPPFATVHVIPGETRAIQAAPLLGSDGSHWQLCRDLVRMTVYGTRNFEALTLQDFVNQFSLDTDAIGVMNMPVMRDEKREQPELMTIAQKKSIEFEVSYYQATARAIARQLIEEALVYLYVDDVSITPQTVYDVSAALRGLDDGGNDEGFNFRQVLPPGALLSSSQRSMGRITILFGSQCPPTTGVLVNMAIAQAGTTLPDFAENPVRITFGGTVTAGPGLPVVSDEFTLPQPFDVTKSYVVSGFIGAGTPADVSCANRVGDLGVSMSGYFGGPPTDESQLISPSVTYALIDDFAFLLVKLDLY